MKYLQTQNKVEKQKVDILREISAMQVKFFRSAHEMIKKRMDNYKQIIEEERQWFKLTDRENIFIKLEEEYERKCREEFDKCEN